LRSKERGGILQFSSPEQLALDFQLQFKVMEAPAAEEFENTCREYFAAAFQRMIAGHPDVFVDEEYGTDPGDDAMSQLFADT